MVKNIHDALVREVNNRARKRGLTLSQGQVLLTLSEHESGMRSFKELEADLNVSQATVAGLVKRLEQKGLVEAVDDPVDRRVKHAKLTARGVAECDEAHVDMDATERWLTRGLTEIETRVFYELLRKVSDTVL
jgi:DNA-binding MarR family transcriptional regulator